MALRILNLVKIESLYVVTAIEFTWCVVESASEPDILCPWAQNVWL